MLSLLAATACRPPLVTPETTTTADQSLRSPTALREELDEVLQFTYDERDLNLREHAAWQILHGALTYQRSFPVLDGERRVSAVEHLLNGGSMKGWDVEVVEEPGTERRGLRAHLDLGSKEGQGHWDQWFAILAQCGLAENQPIRVGEQVVTMKEFVQQVLADVPRNLQREYSWTLIGLTLYLPTDFSWVAADGETWTIERLVQYEVEQDLNASPCGGSHRLIGLTMALNQRLASGLPLDGSWAAAERRIQDAIQVARDYQNPDGSFSANYFARPGTTPDLAHNLGTTGHTLEFLVLAMTDEQLAEPWVQRCVSYLCDVFRRTRGVPLECGALYHAAHGLILYRQRVFGPQSYGDTDLSNAALPSDATSPLSPE